MIKVKTKQKTLRMLTGTSNFLRAYTTISARKKNTMKVKGRTAMT